MSTNKWRVVHYDGFGKMWIMKKDLSEDDARTFLEEQKKIQEMKALRGVDDEHIIDPFMEEESTPEEVQELLIQTGLN